MAGRKKAVIDWDKVNKYLQAHCPGTVIARMIGIDNETLYDAVKERYKMDFSEYSRQKKEEGVSLMETSIYKDAITKGGVDRMFWLKNKAGWKDKQEFDHNVNVPSLPDIIIK